MSYWALIGTADLADSAVTTAKVADDAITNAKIATGAVNSDSIADGSIVNADVSASAAIAYSKLNLTGSILFADFDASVTLDDFSVAGTINMSNNQFSNLDPANASGEAVEYDQWQAALSGATYRIVSATGNLLSSDDYVEGDSSGGAITLTLPAILAAGESIEVKRVGANDVIVDTADAALIDGAASVTLDVNYRAYEFVSNGTNWRIF